MNNVDYSISEQRNKLYSHKKAFSPKEAGAIMLNIDPMYLRDLTFPDVDLLALILEELAESGEFKDFEYENNNFEQWVDKISSKELGQWALSNEYHWVNHSTNKNDIHSVVELNQQEQERSQVEELKTRIAELEAQNLKLSEQLSSEIIQDYEGNIPPKTDKDKLAHAFKLIIQKSEFIKMNEGIYPTYSQLHTLLKVAYPTDTIIPAKNTLKKYLEP